jgi:hypothetical protein
MKRDGSGECMGFYLIRETHPGKNVTTPGIAYAIMIKNNIIVTSAIDGLNMNLEIN